MAHWSKIGKDPPWKLLGNRVFALTFASSCSARTRVTSTVSIHHEQLPVSSEGWSLPGRPTMPPSSDLVRLEHSFASKTLRFKCCKKTAVQRGSPSWIWQHGTEARTAGDAKAWWLCNQCWDKRKIVVYRIGTTHYSICHLRDEHRLSERGPIESEESPAILTAVQSSPQAANLVAQVDLDAFKAALIRWLCLAHIALSCVEVESFRQLVFILNPAVYAFLSLAGNTIRAFVIREFQDRKERVQAALGQS